LVRAIGGSVLANESCGKIETDLKSNLSLQTLRWMQSDLKASGAIDAIWRWPETRGAPVTGSQRAGVSRGNALKSLGARE
jgi:hypothetical protein